MTALDNDHLFAVTMSVMAMSIIPIHMGASAAILAVMMRLMTAMHAAFARLDNDALCAGHRRRRNNKCSHGCNNKTKLPHFLSLSFE
ncbi:MAG: hypothetical protein Q7V17_13135 [Afipia sp.]|nr:hypothetical protein [Afipia sp.]